MSKRQNALALNALQIKNETRDWYAFEGCFGEVVHNARYFFAWKKGHLMGIYITLKEAMESIAWGEKGSSAKAREISLSHTESE